MRILIIDQCSGSKSYPESCPVYSADDIDEYGLEALRNREESATKRAQKLYTGRQQEYIDTAVRTLRAANHEVERYFVSAGFGLVAENKELPPYEVTFSSMGAAQIDARSEQLGIREDVTEVLTRPYDIIFFALWADYSHAIDLGEQLAELPEAPIAVVFNQEDLSTPYENVVSIDARTDEAKEFGTIVVALKGLYLQQFAAQLDVDETIESPDKSVAYCTTVSLPQSSIDDF